MFVFFCGRKHCLHVGGRLKSIENYTLLKIPLRARRQAEWGADALTRNLNLKLKSKRFGRCPEIYTLSFWYCVMAKNVCMWTSQTSQHIVCTGFICCIIRVYFEVASPFLFVLMALSQHSCLNLLLRKHLGDFRPLKIIWYIHATWALVQRQSSLFPDELGRGQGSARVNNYFSTDPSPEH